ncbi:MAG TPA: endo-1,4-beta-xylanase, partial [Polyangiaceae bacterium]
MSLTIGLCIVGCSASDGDSGVGIETPGVGGSTSATGGVVSSGGSNPTGGMSTAKGGTAASSVTQAQATGGLSPATGGKAATGGAAVGGASVAPSSGGTSYDTATQTGGARQTGGASSATGGAKPTGGTSNATGGAKPTGGSSYTAGGKTTSGGASSTGGASASSGAASTVKFVGNITTGSSIDVSGMKYSKYWDQITPENAGKWGSVQSSASGSMNWATLDSIYDYTQKNNIIFKQHCFVWGKQQPSGTPTLANVEEWIKTFCERYPNTKVIDVVNEPPPHTTPSYTSNLGAGEGGTYPWITKAFKLARKYCGNAVLILNDYNNVELTGDRNHTVDIVKDIKANGAPIDAVGCQSHGLKGASGSTVQTNLAYLNSQTGLPIYITEF